MVIKNTEIVKILEGIVERLDEVVADTDMIDADDRVGYGAEEYDDVDDDNDGMGSSLLISENPIDEIKQILSEEIDNIRRLIEVIEE